MKRFILLCWIAALVLQVPPAVGCSPFVKGAASDGLAQAASPTKELRFPVAHLFATAGNSDLVGTWAGRSGQSDFSLVLNADGSGSLNGLSLQWQLSGGILSLATSKGAFQYRVSVSGDSMTLSGTDLKQPLVFHRVKQNEPAGLFSAAAGSDDDLPIPGNPPLTKEMVDKGSQFFEWLLDAQLTVEQRAQFRDSLAESWKDHRQDEIDATVNVVNYQDQLSQKTPEERALVREVLRKKFLDLMRQTPNDVLSRWVLDIYDSAHVPIADGSPPLTSQVADAYAEFVSFMIVQCLGKSPFKPDRHFKDALAQRLAAEYSSYTPEQQRQFSQVPLLWSVLRFKWARLSEPERKTYRQQWAPAAKKLLSGTPAGDATGEPESSARSSGSLDDYFKNYNERLFVNNMASSSFATTMSLHLNMWR